MWLRLRGLCACYRERERERERESESGECVCESVGVTLSISKPVHNDMHWRTHFTLHLKVDKLSPIQSKLSPELIVHCTIYTLTCLHTHTHTHTHTLFQYTDTAAILQCTT